MLDSLTMDGKAALASRTAAYGRACYHWAVKRGSLASNPFQDLPLAPIAKRERVLTEPEIHAVWELTRGAGSFNAIVRMLMLTGQRREEVTAMTCDEIAPDHSAWKGNGVRTIIVETASRFARDLIVQETGWRFLRNAGVTLVAADSPDSFLDETPTAVLVRQVLGAVAQFEKQALVAKLRKARERKKAATGKCGGRHSVAEAKPETVALAKKLARYPVNGRHRSLREIAAELETAGHVTSKSTPYGAAAIARMIS